MVYFYNATGWLGTILTGLTTNVTGSEFLTMLLIFILFIVTGLALKVPPLALSIMYLPLLIVMASMGTEWLAIFGSILIYLGYTVAILIYPTN